MATTYARVHYTTNRGQTFHGKPISFSAAVLRNAKNLDAALDVLAYLLSPAGQQLVQAAHFLPGVALVGGDAASVPGRLQSLIQGEYQQYPGLSMLTYLRFKQIFLAPLPSQELDIAKRSAII